MSEMTAEIAAQLREAFDAAHTGKLPRVTCGGCRDARSRVCDKHAKQRCDECGNYLTTAHLHLDYVGHADVTDRLLQVDPAWSWEPVAFDAAGLPAIDQYGGLWIRLTVAGVTRLGYGDADGKRGGNAVKEAIGDALRNAAMRFGVALDLWRKEGVDETSSAPARRAPRKAATSSVRAGATARAEPGKAVVRLFKEITDAAALGELTAAWQQVLDAHAAGDVSDVERRQLRGHADKRKQQLERGEL